MVELGHRSISESVDVGNSLSKVACACALLDLLACVSCRLALFLSMSNLLKIF